MIHGPDLSETKDIAKGRVQAAFTALAERDGVPPTLRAMYVRKAEQAQLVVDGGASELVAGEAAIRGITPRQMAQAILAMAKSGGDELELKRMATNVAIDKATTQAQIVAILSGLGIDFAEPPVANP